MILIILIAVLILAIVFGALAGLVKGYSKTSFWGGVVMLTLLLERLVGFAVKKGGMGFTIGVMVTAIISILILTLIFEIFRMVMDGKIEERRTLSAYENYDKLEENNVYILDAVDRKDKKAYKKYRNERKKIKVKSGPWGVVDKVLGSVAGAFNWFFGAFIVSAFILIFIDSSQIATSSSVFVSFFASAFWAKFLGAIAMDVIVISIISLAIRAGYKGGISSLLTFIVIIGLLIAFGFASYSLAASPAMSGMVSGMENSLPAMLGGLRHTLAVAVTALIFFLLSLVVVILVGIFLPKLLDKFKENVIFNAVDGVFGAILFTAAVIALLLVFGGIAYTLYDLPAFEHLNWYMNNSYFADCFYACNPMAQVFAALPLRALFGKTQ